MKIRTALRISVPVVALAGCQPAVREPAPEAAVDVTLQDEMRQDLAQVRDKFLGLAEAVPDSTYGWRPEEGVRSVGEVYMHIAASNIGLAAGALGIAPPSDADPAWYDFQHAEKITAKATILKALASSFAYLDDVISATPTDRLSETVDLFGQESTVRGALLLIETHCHEHLGQSIAYARMNGVTPPWSAP